MHENDCRPAGARGNDLIERFVTGWDVPSRSDCDRLDEIQNEGAIAPELETLLAAKLAIFKANFLGPSKVLPLFHSLPKSDSDNRLLDTALRSAEAVRLQSSGDWDGARYAIEGIDTTDLPFEYRIRIAVQRATIWQMTGEKEVARETCLRAKREVEEAGHEPLLAVILVNLGISYKNSCDFHLAISCYDEAGRLARRIGLPYLTDRIRFNTAILWRRLGLLQRAREELDHFDKLPETEFDSGNPPYLNERCRLHVWLEEEGEAELWFKLLCAAKSESRNARSSAICNKVEAEYHCLGENWNEAINSLDRGLHFTETLGRANDIKAELLSAKARVYLRLERDEEARDLARQALEACEHAGETYEMGAIFRTLGMLAERAGNLSEAEDLLHRAVSYYRNLDEKFECAHCHRELALFCQRRGGEHLREAFRHGASALGLFDAMGIKPRVAQMQDFLNEVGMQIPSAPFRANVDLSEIGKEQGIITADPAMTRILAEIHLVATSQTSVMISGETGTGKELVARALHAMSDRSEEAFVVVNCAAIPAELLESELFGHLAGSFTGASADRKGKFSQADGGVLFLDEIGDLSSRLQAKLLRVLEDGTYTPVGSDRMLHSDVRVISATNRDLEAMVEVGQFRRDLLFRLNHVTLKLPPLRKRGVDVEVLARYFLHGECENLGRRIELDNKALDRIRKYPWPGNVRELQNFIRRTALYALESGKLTVDLFPQEYLSPLDGLNTDLASIVLGAEKEAILLAVARSGGNKAEAARSLSISRSTLNEKIRRYELSDQIAGRLAAVAF